MTEIIVLILQEPQGSNSPHFEKHCARLQTPWSRKFTNFHNAFVTTRLLMCKGRGKRGKNRKERGAGGEGSKCINERTLVTQVNKYQLMWRWNKVTVLPF